MSGVTSHLDMILEINLNSLFEVIIVEVFIQYATHSYGNENSLLGKIKIMLQIIS